MSCWLYPDDGRVQICNRLRLRPVTQKSNPAALVPARQPVPRCVSEYGLISQALPSWDRRCVVDVEKSDLPSSPALLIRVPHDKWVPNT